jgi:hypothetical protein
LIFKIFYIIYLTITFSVYANIARIKTWFLLFFLYLIIIIVSCSFSRISFFFIYLFIESLDILLSMHNCSCRTLECMMCAYKLSFTNWFWMSEHTYDERLDNDLSSSCHYQLDQHKKKIHMYDILIYILSCLFFGFFHCLHFT